MVWQLLAKPLLGVAADAVKGFVDTKKAKAELKVTEIKAATKLKQDAIAGKVKWEMAAVDQMKGSWKDEFVLLALMLPAIAVFIPGWTPHIKAGFEALHELPDYYKHLLYLACSVSLGVRAAPGVMGMFGKKK
ncbi:MAG: hypothetical protein Unbinned2350contig1001_43 [Prokaryotic dsDNA virus sp.]|nr:MAG: hypothetical protein Unbinned2350contig1001_43 [Prokaryotic dsDNA virus sp.]|tara:strand:- start:112 stop:510 length:399 start_codon:yes stop_codon:yes gene_type:complete